ncbi:lipopolysaccharide heptosyltransferase family protein, partial [Helicobacter pylori]
MKSLLSLFLKSKLSYLYYYPYIAFVLMVATIAKIPLIQKIPVIRRFFNSRYSFQKDSLIRIQNQLDRLLTLTKPTPPPIRKKTLCFIRLDIIGD